MPVSLFTPIVVASPKACVAASNSPRLSPGLGASGATFGVDDDPLHPRQIDHQTAIANGAPGNVVSPASHRHEQVLRPRERDRADDIVNAGAIGDHRRFLIDHTVPHFARLVIGGVAR